MTEILTRALLESLKFKHKGLDKEKDCGGDVHVYRGLQQTLCTECGRELFPGEMVYIGDLQK